MATIAHWAGGTAANFNSSGPNAQEEADMAHHLNQDLLDQKHKAERANLQLRRELAEEKKRAAKTIADLTRYNAELQLHLTAKGPELDNTVSTDGDDGDDEEEEDAKEDLNTGPPSPGTPKSRKVSKGPQVYFRATQTPKKD